MLEILNTLLPGFNLPISDGGTSSLLQAGQLRGLSSGHTLVLINGKRRHITAKLGVGDFDAASPVDLALIPSGAIERIEVLRDGASAIYGSDAIAGVINVITKKTAEGGGLAYTQGVYSAGDGRSRSLHGDAGFELGDGGHIHLSAQVNDQEGTIRTGPVPSAFLYYFPTNSAGKQILPSGNLSNFPTLPAGATPDPREATRDNYAWKNKGIRPYTLTTGVIDFGLPLSDAVELYGFLTAGDYQGEAIQNFRHPSRDENVRAIWPDGFQPYHDISEIDYELVSGLKGRTGSEWDWDLSSGYGYNKIDFWIRDSVNPTYGLASKTAAFTSGVEYGVWTNNLDLRKSLAVDWLFSPLQLSSGAEYRREHYINVAGEAIAYSHGGAKILDGPNTGKTLGAGLAAMQSATITRPEDEADVNRSSAAVYVGASGNITAPWLVDLAGRYERYSDVGSKATGRITSRYEFTPITALRGTFSTGFQTPSLAAQSYQSTGISNTFTTYTLRATSPTAQALGAHALKPESSRSLSLGLVFNPEKTTNVALDVFRIDVKDRIAASTTIRESLYPGAGALVAAAGKNSVDAIQYYLNAADTSTKGIEATLDYLTTFDKLGRIKWTAAASYIDAKVTRIADTPAQLAALNVPMFSVANQNKLLYTAPNSKQIFSADWTRGGWDANLRATHYGAIKRYGQPTQVATSGPYAGQTDISYSIGNLWIADVELGYHINLNTRINININNLFDERAPLLPEPLLQSFQTYAYAPGGPVDASGRFFSASLQWDW